MRWIKEMVLYESLIMLFTERVFSGYLKNLLLYDYVKSY